MGTINVGTRASKLALRQAELVAQALARTHGLARAHIAITPFCTTGDRLADRALGEAGGKGLFTLEIEAALLAGRIAMAVHSMKDMPTILPEGLRIAACLPREDPADCLICRTASGIETLPEGALIGTASLRRAAQIRHRRADLRVETLRGSVETRLARMREGAFDATLLASAGLRRLGWRVREATRLPVSQLLPAAAQGAIGVETRTDDREAAALLAPLDHAPTSQAIRAERAFLDALDGSCRTPIGAFARIRRDGRLHFRGEILTPDGSQCKSVTRFGPPEAAEEIGQRAAEAIRQGTGEEILRAAHAYAETTFRSP